MDRNRQDIRYEELYNRLLERGMALHENNKRRIRAGLIFLGVFRHVCRIHISHQRGIH